MRRRDLVTVSLPGDYGRPRPALIVQSDLLHDLDSVLLWPVTSDLRNAEFRVTLEPSPANGLRALSQVMVRTVRQHFEIHGASYATRRRELIESGVWVEAGDTLVFSRDPSFASASAAASVITGQNQNAEHWVAQDGTNLGDLLRRASNALN